MQNKSVATKVITGLMVTSMSIYTSVAVYAADVGNSSSITSIISDTGVSSGVPTPPPDDGGTNPPGGGEDTSVTSGPAKYLLSGQTITLTNQEIAATDINESIVKVADSGNLTLTNSRLTKIGDTSADGSSNFYGLNAGVLATAGSKIILKDASVNTSASGANAVFATGEGAHIEVSNVAIKTTKDSSRGLDATLGGTVIGKNVNISTEGAHCGGLATDRGGGSVSVSNSSVSTAGEGSPGIYSTGAISATDSSFKATGSEAAAIEGRNSITLTNCSLSGALKHGVMIYQSFSGDAEVGKGTFTMTGGSLKAEVGPLFYSTNTDAVINIKGVALENPSGKLLKVSADRWGTTGSNGANVDFTADSEQLKGDITCDSISTIAATLKNNTTLKGSINADNTAKSVTLSLDSTSTWNVAGTSYIGKLVDGNTTLANIKDNGNTIYYDSSANSWLNGKTHILTDGGSLVPINN